MRRLKFQSTYQSVMTYAPPKVKEILAKEVPRIQENIEKEAELFGEELAEFIQQEVDSAMKTVEAESKALQAQIAQLTETLSNATALNIEALNIATATLRNKLDEYDKVVRGVGESVRGVVKNGLRAAGLPLP